MSSDGASVNSGSNSGLIKLFQEDYPWLAFVRCFSHRLELSLKDALLDFLEPVGTLLTHLFYTYSNSAKTIESLYQEGQYEMYGSHVKPLKGGETRWINYKLPTMGRSLEKFGLYVGHMKTTSSTKNSAARANLQEKLKNWWTPKFFFILHFSQTFWLKLRNSAC